MLKDQFEIAFAYLRSRMNRVIKYVKTLIKTGQVKKNQYTGGVLIEDLDKRKAEF